MTNNDNKIIAVRTQDARNAGWLHAAPGDVLTADGWTCSSDRPGDCGQGLYGWQVHPVPTTPQREGWSAAHTTSAVWVAWESVDPDKIATLWGKVATYQARIVRSACDPIEMLAWVKAHGYTVPSQLVTAAGCLSRERWGWMVRLGVVVFHDAQYRAVVGRGWPITRADYRDSSAARGYGLPAEWHHTFAQALATGAWDADGKRVPGHYDRDVQQALQDGVTVDAAFYKRMVHEWGGKIVRKHEITRIIAGDSTHAGAYEAIRSLYLAREAARLGRAPAVDVSAEPEAKRRLRTAERGQGARSDRRSVAVWHRGEIVGWVTPYRAGAFRAPDHVTTVGALRAKAKRTSAPPSRYSVNKGTEAQIVERARKAIRRRGWSLEQYQRTSGGWGRSAGYGMRCVDRVHGVTIATWAYGTAPTVEAALAILDTDRAMRGGKKA